MEWRIGICDDEIKWQRKVADILSEYGRKKNISLRVSTFSDGNTLLTYRGQPLHILFMDIGLGGMNGIDLACTINRRWPDCQIVYLTKSLEFIFDVYRSEHLYFVLKDQFEDDLNEIMDKAKQRMKQMFKKVALTLHGSKQIMLSLDEIMYFEREERITRVVSTKSELITEEKISALAEKLPPMDFVRCHNSFIVYLPAVAKYTNKAFQMCDGKEILISRGYREQTRRAFEYWAGINMDSV